MQGIVYFDKLLRGGVWNRHEMRGDCACHGLTLNSKGTYGDIARLSMHGKSAIYYWLVVTGHTVTPTSRLDPNPNPNPTIVNIFLTLSELYPNPIHNPNFYLNLRRRVLW